MCELQSFNVPVFYSLNSSAFHLRMSVTCIKERIVNGNQFSISINSINFFNLKPICLILFHLYCCLDTVLRNGTFSSAIGQSESTAVGPSMFYYINNLSFLHCGRLYPTLNHLFPCCSCWWISPIRCTFKFHCSLPWTFKLLYGI